MTPEEFALNMLSYVGTAYLYETTGDCPTGADMAWAEQRLQDCRDRDQWESVRDAIENMMEEGIISGNVTDGVFLQIPPIETQRFTTMAAALVASEDEPSQNVRLFGRLLIGYLCGEAVVALPEELGLGMVEPSTYVEQSFRPTYAWRNPPPKPPVLGC